MRGELGLELAFRNAGITRKTKDITGETEMPWSFVDNVHGGGAPLL